MNDFYGHLNLNQFLYSFEERPLFQKTVMLPLGRKTIGKFLFVIKCRFSLSLSLFLFSLLKFLCKQEFYCVFFLANLIIRFEFCY